MYNACANLSVHHLVASSGKQSIAMVAGEVSGDLLGARVIGGLRAQVPDIDLYGIGGKHMMEHGFISACPMDKLTVRGLFEVIPRYREIRSIQRALYQDLLIKKPDIFVGVDYPGFNIDLELQLIKQGIPTVHFISPQIWASRAWRIKKITQAVSHMLVIFPFEEEIYRKAGVPVTYVGHPLAEVIPMHCDKAAAVAALGLAPDARVVAILPGSRMSEIKYHAAIFVETAKLLLQRDRHLQFVMPMVGIKERLYFLSLIEQAGLSDVPIQLIDGDSHTVLAAADVVLVASGTASLEVALFKKPMVIAYKMLWATWEIAKRIAYQPWIGLPNILAQESLVPEYLQYQMTPTTLADALWEQLNDDNLRSKLVNRFTQMHHTLLRNTAKECAQVILSVMGAR